MRENKVTVIDTIMGGGKTTWVIDYMNASPNIKKFIYITPYLDEVRRVKNKVTHRAFQEPEDRYGSKMRDLKRMIADGKDICSTHSLFQAADDELFELLTDSGYTLVLDEVMSVIEAANISRQDINTLKEVGYIEIQGNRVKWTYDEYAEGRFNDIKQLAQAGNLFIHRGRFIIWAFPAKIFEAFDEVLVLTYLFDAQIQRYYYDLFDIEYQYKSVQFNGEKYELTDYDKKKENRSEVMGLIDLYEGALNEFGERKNALSSTWLRNSSDEKREEIKKKLYTFFNYHAQAKADEVLWTTIKELKKDDNKKKVKGINPRGYSRQIKDENGEECGPFVSLNLRATNKYRHTRALAYVFNRYMSPIERAFFQDNGVKVNQDLLAVSDLLQWVWRSRIRDGEPIKLYLPSSRMRMLLKKWSEYEI